MKGLGLRTFRQRMALWRMMRKAKRRGARAGQNRAAAQRALAVLARAGMR